MKGPAVVTAHEMRRLESLAYAQGESEERFMEAAALGIAQAAERRLPHPSAGKICLLIGKGNNGGDALAAGTFLLQKKYSVEGLFLYPLESCSPLCQKMAHRFEKAGGALKPFHPDFAAPALLIVGLVGTGFQGKAEGILQQAIESAQRAGAPILAIDVPAGVDPTTGEVGSVAIHATETVALGLPKLGYFIGKGWDHLGEMTLHDFGLPSSIVSQAQAEAYLFDPGCAPRLLPKIQRSRHKYQRGYLLAVAGSKGMPGAALLACRAALRTGAGIVRLFHSPGMETEAAPDELIHEPFDLSRWSEEMKRAKALLIGPGLGRTGEVDQLLHPLFSQLNLPCVVDADALYYLSRHPETRLSSQLVLTPHHEEMKRILGTAPTFTACQAYVESKQVTLVLKGAPTILFQKGEKPLIIPRGDPGMATAGSGDVLTGMIGALLAQGLKPYTAAALGVFLHALAGEQASKQKTSYTLIASDLIEQLPAVFKHLLKSLSFP